MCPNNLQQCQLNASGKALLAPAFASLVEKDSWMDLECVDELVKTRILAPPALHARVPLEMETDDLFARTGFDDSPAEAPDLGPHAMLSQDGYAYARRGGSGSKPPGWLPSFSC
eukprot:s2389_g5.t1